MENKLMIFENEAFGKVRTLNLNGEPWFVAADVCKALELGNPSMTVERLDDDEKGISTIDTLGGKQRMAIINEPGLYSLVITSRKPEAKAFKRWITHEVIPAIRKHGVYITDEKLKLFAEHPELLDALMKSLYAAHAENLRHRAERQTLLPKADYYDAFMDADGCTNLRTTAKELNVPVICLSQLSRANESRSDKRPMLSDLRESGAIEQDADIVMFIYRDDYYDDESENKNIAEIIIAKNRHGATGTIELQWVGQYTTFSNPDRIHEE